MIKKISTLVVATIIAATTFAQSTKSNNFKVNLFSPLVKTGSFFFERKLDSESSLQLGFLFTAASISDVSISGFAITPEYRRYLSNNKEALEGFYVGPYLRYQQLTLKADGDEGTLSSFGGGLLVGHQWIFSNIVSLDLFAGPAYNGGKLKITSGSDFDEPGVFNGFSVRAGVALGLAF